MFKYIVIGVLLVSSIYAGSMWRDKQGNLVKDTTSMKSKNGFGANLVSVNEKNFFKVWNTPSQTVNIDVIDTIHREDELIFPIMFGGCQTNKENKCNIIGNFLILAPDGSIYTDVKNILIFKGNPQPNHGLNVSTGYIKIIIEKIDLLGTYKVKAHVIDMYSNAELNLETSFTVVDDNVSIKKKVNISKTETIESYKPTEKDLKVSKWMTYAYKENSENDMQNIMHMLNSKMFTQDKQSLFVLAVFLSERFKLNDSYLVTHQEDFSNLDNNALEMLLFALNQSSTKNANILYEKLLKNMRNEKFLNYIKSVKHFQLLDMDIMQPSMIDALWASFMATGKKEYVEKIITILGLPEKGVNNLLLLGSTKWSLLSNAKQHDKVLKTCKEYISRDKNIQKNLNEILIKVNNNE